ncbi:MAG: hypothetical protein IJB50_01290 [Clostridia bacterium]|nr:hypothetical protein [Clostridia bacterium]
MVKTFKRIAALAMAIALVVCFAVSASAVQVTTTTQYAADKSNVNVSVNVSGAEGNVTYYATKDSTPVYIDQAEVIGGVATFNFQTAAANLKSTVKVGYTNGAASSWDIDAKTISYDGNVIGCIPTEETAGSVTINYTADAGKTVKVTADNAQVASSYNAGVISVTLSNVTDNVVLTVEQVDAGNDTSAANCLDAACKTLEDGARQFTVLGAATGTEEFGVIITAADKEIATTYTDAAFATAFTADEKFEALTKAEKGIFAVQIVDEGETGDELFRAGASYNVAVYVKTSNNNGYRVVKAAEAVTVQ